MDNRRNAHRYTEPRSHYSNESRSSGKTKSTKIPKKLIAINIAVIFVSIVFLLLGSVCIYSGRLLGRYTYVAPESSSTAPLIDKNGEVVESKTSPVATQETYDDPEMLGSLYHDDAIINILLMGVDNYQLGDVGRTDSMMLISIDRRHGELKVTSFMRDLYVAIPRGYANNRLNAAFSLEGPTLLVETIEQNFCCDIDKYVIIDFSAFAGIIDALGGVEVDLTQDEADCVNEHSEEDPNKAVSAGVQTLTGLQARYYARIRNVSTANGTSDDYGRTERQRNVFKSIISKFKNSDILTITRLADQIIPNIKSDLSQEEILAIVSNSLTYMKYPVSETHIPAEGMYDFATVDISGWAAAVLVPKTGMSTLYVNNFIYGDDFPELEATLKSYGFLED